MVIKGKFCYFCANYLFKITKNFLVNTSFIWDYGGTVCFQDFNLPLLSALEMGVYLIF